MPKSYAQLMTQIDAVRDQAESARGIEEAIAVFGLTAADLGLSGAGKGLR